MENQPANTRSREDSFKPLLGAEAIKKIQEIAKEADTCFFCTHIETGQPFEVRPMSTQEVDEYGNLWFLSGRESHKNRQIEQDSYVQLLYKVNAHEGFATVYGRAGISYNKEKIKELWRPLHKAWFPGGEDDPSITVIKVIPEDGYYWDTKHGGLVAFAKVVASAITGAQMDDSVEGPLKP